MSPSPVIKKEEPDTIGFPLVVARVLEGKRFTRKEWNNREIHVLLRNGRLQIHKADGNYYDLIVSDGDLVGSDWIEVLAN